MAVEASYPAVPLRHLALFYHGSDEYSETVAGFAKAGLEMAERVLVAVPGHRLAGLREALGMQRDDVSFADMTSLGRNPARIIPALQAFISGGSQPVRFVGEPIWPWRSAAEVREATRHEALINIAFAASNAQILCPYDAAGLPGPVLADACRTHPLIAGAGSHVASPAYQGPRSVPESCARPLPPPPPGTEVLRYDADLRGVRQFVADRASDARLPATITANLILAASEIAANTLRHSGGGGTVSAWPAAGELICELRDTGHITDPLAGRRVPDPEQTGGHGLWLVNRSVDLTEVRTAPGRTVTRLHVRIRGSRPAQSGSPTCEVGDPGVDRRGVDTGGMKLLGGRR
jgi:anti-sigma regulatory factor (Ser/Thr protein kinase)